MNRHKEAAKIIKDGLRELREKLAGARTDEERTNYEGQTARLNRELEMLRRRYVLRIGLPIAILFVVILASIYLYQHC